MTRGLDEIAISRKGTGGYDAGDRVLIRFVGDVALATPQRMIPGEGVSDRSYWTNSDPDGEPHRFTSLDDLVAWLSRAIMTQEIDLPEEASAP